ncbi:MAG: hypothetical protein Q8P41_20365 [Pseudomonadota bacterium]|nr:hypothetical protein [Pseudomonadota bacterium]
MKFWVPAGVAFLIAGVLELLFLALSVLGTLTGGVMSVAALLGELRNEEALIGPVVLLFYGLWLVVTAIAGPLHIAAGVSIVTGHRNRKLLWIATGASLLPFATIYCAPTSLVAGVLGLLAAIFSDPRIEGTNPA